MLDHPKGAGSEGDIRLDFDPRVRLEFHGSKISSDGGLLLFRELDKTLGLHDLAGRSLRDTRTGKNGVHSLVGLLRQSTFGRLAGYPDVNDADRLSRDPVMRQIVGGRAVDGQAASTSQMARFETDMLITLPLWLTCPDSGLMPCTMHNRPSGSLWIWTVPSAPPMAIRKARHGMVTLAASAITRCSCSTSSAILSAAPCARAMSTALMVGRTFWPQS